MICVAVFLFIGFFELIPTESRQVDPTVFGDVNLKSERANYNRLLGNLVKVNTNRWQSLKKTLDLAQAPVGLSPRIGSKPQLRHRSDDEDEDILGLVIAVNDKDRKDRSKNPSSSSSDDETSSDSVEKSDNNEEFTPFQQMMLRQSWCKSCSKKAAKRCRKACKQAVNSGCSGYHCSSRVKDRIKKECKRQCRSGFDVGDRNGSDWE